MFFYFLILLYWLLLFFFGKKGVTNSGLFWAILPLFFIMALKSVSVGCDTISYYNRYIGAIDTLSAASMITEPGFNLAGYFFHDILGVPFWVFNAVISAFVCYILGLFLKHFCDNAYLSLFFYMTIGLFTVSMSGLRQITAISICTIPIIWARLCEKRGGETRKHKRVRFLAGMGCVLLAITFHNSAIIFLPVLFLLDLRLTKRQTIVIMMVAIAAFLFRGVLVGLMGHFAFARYTKYDLEEGYAMNILALLVPIAIGLFCVLVSRPEKGERVYSRPISLMFIFLALQVAFNILALSHNQIARLGYFFMNAYIIVVPYALRKLSGDLRPLAIFVIILLCLVYFYMGTNEGTLRIDNYKFFWEEPMYLKN